MFNYVTFFRVKSPKSMSVCKTVTLREKKMIRKLVTVSDLFRVILPNKEDLSLERERVFTIWFKEKSVFVCVCSSVCMWVSNCIKSGDLGRWQEPSETHSSWLMRWPLTSPCVWQPCKILLPFKVLCHVPRLRWDISVLYMYTLLEKCSWPIFNKVNSDWNLHFFFFGLNRCSSLCCNYNNYNKSHT